jgi:hypothetical protein
MFKLNIRTGLIQLDISVLKTGYLSGYPKIICRFQFLISNLLPEYHVVDIHPGYLICCQDI